MNTNVLPACRPIDASRAEKPYATKINLFLGSLVALLFTINLTGCIDLGMKVGAPCEASDFCSQTDTEVCGSDGNYYACAALAECEEVKVEANDERCQHASECPFGDPENQQDVDCFDVCGGEYTKSTDARGCTICACAAQRDICPDEVCAGSCPEGYTVEFDEDGCNLCLCVPETGDGECVDAQCDAQCPPGYDYMSDNDGCRTCICEPVGGDVCPPLECGGECPPDRRRKVDQNGCETCECELVDEEPPVCDVLDCNQASCPNGYKLDDQGCETCECIEEDSGDTCEDGGCSAVYCGESRARCVSPADEADLDDCGDDPDFMEPEPLCDCSGEDCATTACTSDDDCPGDGDLCVLTPEDDQPGYCITSTCQQFRSRYYQNLDSKYTSCTEDAECEGVMMKLYCCGTTFVNQQGREYFEQVNRFVDHTSCGVELTEQCDVDCSIFSYESVCVRGTCEMKND